MDKHCASNMREANSRFCQITGVKKAFTFFPPALASIPVFTGIHQAHKTDTRIVLNFLENHVTGDNAGHTLLINGLSRLHHRNRYTWILGRADYTFTQLTMKRLLAFQITVYGIQHALV
ncbi:uncharacterized protein LOC143427242 [Xylocopa sonorina]|uniref:uncharacterized protein LOC143427242 n=1 Tax=Xylocopa sonorina TaxID=1818115 RepID=UPI00403ACA06